MEKEGASRELIDRAALFKGAAPASSPLLFGGQAGGDSQRCLATLSLEAEVGQQSNGGPRRAEIISSTQIVSTQRNHKG